MVIDNTTGAQGIKDALYKMEAIANSLIQGIGTDGLQAGRGNNKP